MKAASKLVLVMAGLFLVAGFPGIGLPWGDAPTHFSISAEPEVLIKIDPDYSLLFVQASVCPDIANTLLFRSTGRTYVHDDSFVEDLFHVAERPNNWRWKRYWKPQWLVTAQAWKAHLVADEVAHTEYVPEEQVKHSLVEFDVDTCVYYEKPVPTDLGVGSWEDVNISEDCCDPWLIFWASYVHTKGKKPVYRWMTLQALQTLKTAIAKEYDIIADRDSEAAEKQLEFLVPGKDWHDSYDDSVKAVADELP